LSLLALDAPKAGGPNPWRTMTNENLIPIKFGNDKRIDFNLNAVSTVRKQR